MIMHNSVKYVYLMSFNSSSPISYFGSSQSAPSTGFSFGSGQSVPSTGFSFGGDQPAPSMGFSFGSGQSRSSGFSFRHQVATTAESAEFNKWYVENMGILREWSVYQQHIYIGKESEIVCAYLVCNKMFDMLKLARNAGCSFNERTCLQVAMRDDYNALNWLQANNCKWNAQEICEYAVKYGNLKLLRYMVNNAGKKCAKNAYQIAASSGRLCIIQWIMINGIEHSREKIVQIATQNNQSHIVDWVSKMEC